MSIFKAYDIRGIYGEELTEELSYRIGRSFASMLKCKKVVVGRDMRESSPSIEKALVRGLTDQGANVIKIGLASTPMLYFAVEKLKCDAGINVTASHNPGKYNGFKLTREHAMPISGETGIYKLEKLTKKQLKKPSKKGKVISRKILGDYVKNVFRFVNPKTLNEFKTITDTGNGMAGIIVPKLFKKIPGKAEHLFLKLDGNFPNHEANPLKKQTLRQLQKKVRQKKADIGIAFDGDSDRIGFVDEKGKIVSSDAIISLISAKVLSKKPKSKILYDLRSSKIVPEKIKENRGIPIKTRVGHSYIKNHMRKEKALFAGELSAHYYLKENNYVESPYEVFLMILKIMTETGKTLSQLASPLKKYHKTDELNFKIKNKEKAMKAVKRKFSKAKKTYELDGLSIEYENWWLNLRPSNTEPLLRLNMEADDYQTLKKIKKQVIQILKKH